MDELNALIECAERIKESLLFGQKPTATDLQRLSQLAQSIDREYDEAFQAWVESKASELA